MATLHTIHSKKSTQNPPSCISIPRSPPTVPTPSLAPHQRTFSRFFPSLSALPSTLYTTVNITKPSPTSSALPPLPPLPLHYRYHNHQPSLFSPFFHHHHHYHPTITSLCSLFASQPPSPLISILLHPPPKPNHNQYYKKETINKVTKNDENQTPPTK